VWAARSQRKWGITRNGEGEKYLEGRIKSVFFIKMEKKSDSIVRLIWRALQETTAMKWEYIITIPLTLLMVGALLAEPYIYKLVLDSISSYTYAPLHSISLWQQFSQIFTPLSWIFTLWLIASGAAIVIKYNRNTRFHMHLSAHWADVIAHGMNEFLQKNIFFHLSINNAEKLKIFNRGVDSVYDIAWQVILRIPKALLLLIGYVGLGLYIRADLTLSLLGALVVFMILPVWLGNIAHKQQKYATELWDKMYSLVGDIITNQAVVKFFSRREYAIKSSHSSVVDAANQQNKVRYIWWILDALSSAIEMIIGFVVLIFCVFFYARGLISFGDIVLFLTIASRISGPFMELEASYREVSKLAADYSKYREVLDLPPEPDLGTRTFPAVYENIYFKNLSFIYPETTREVLHGVNITLKRGTKTALIGHTGSGKSTLSNLLARFYEPTSGSILIDELDVRDIALESYRTQFAAVFQDTTLFNDTLRMNLQFVRDGITDEQIISACRDANVLEFIESLPSGFDTVVGERGLKLSGGEKQRIAIARAILADPEILILDEATSALDAKTEHLVSEALERLMEGRTALIIAHRLSTIQRANTIYILEQGSVTASGDHASLYQNSPQYKEMVDFQRHGFIE
jgi:ABC-type multidrug transport system fused ATPase/permease subunit